IVFTENTKSAEEIYNKLQDLRDNIQLYAASNLDTDTIENVVNKAGNDGYLTVTTPMLGRGTDFLTNNPEGFLAINLCTKITKITLWQIYG
ncbi:hypothetical protein ACSLVQ_28285, partial [Klebsiella pneumoniae]|uniref:hypothetical protein n=1 Tax=Klebsiella pneumoniae TaxID=573 RepID=UPI003EE0DAA2